MHRDGCCDARLLLPARWRQSGTTPILFLRSIRLPDVKRVALHAVLPAALIVACTGVWLSYDNFVVTGRWWTTPYQAHDAQYAACPNFLFEEPGAVPAYRHVDMERYYVNWERERFLRKRFAYGFNGSGITKLWISREILYRAPVGNSCGIGPLAIQDARRQPGSRCTWCGSLR